MDPNVRVYLREITKWVQYAGDMQIDVLKTLGKYLEKGDFEELKGKVDKALEAQIKIYNQSILGLTKTTKCPKRSKCTLAGEKARDLMEINEALHAELVRMNMGFALKCGDHKIQVAQLEHRVDMKTMAEKNLSEELESVRKQIGDLIGLPEVGIQSGLNQLGCKLHFQEIVNSNLEKDAEANELLIHQLKCQTIEKTLKLEKYNKKDLQECEIKYAEVIGNMREKIKLILSDYDDFKMRVNTVNLELKNDLEKELRNVGELGKENKKLKGKYGF